MSAPAADAPAASGAAARDGEAPPPSPRGTSGELEMIRPPERGDTPAWKWLLAGIGFYVVFCGVFVGSLISAGDGAAGPPGRPADTAASRLRELVGLGDPFNPAVLFLVAGGIFLTVWATLSVWRDIREIAREEDDIDWILAKKREGVPLVFAAKDRREALFAQKVRSVQLDSGTAVETLVDDRVRRVYASRTESGAAVVVPDELRGIAEKRTARLGSFARYASSLLLLLAVLGTFAGVKTALPALITAVSAGGNMQDSIVDPLRAVADAFGGNALALVGAIAVGLMAQGLALGRRNLLERLELVSAEYIFDNRRSGSADPLRAAVEALHETAQEIRSSSGAFLGIEGGLQALGSRFEAAFVSLDERLSDLVNQQREGLYDRTGAALEELHVRVGRLAAAVSENAGTYAGLVDQIGARATESRSAVEQMRDANAVLARALDGIIRLGDAAERSAATAESSTQLLADSSRRVWEQTEALTRAMEDAGPAFGEVRSSIEAISARFSALDERASRSWAEAGQEMARALSTVAPTGGSAPAAPFAGGEAVTLLRRIAAGLEAKQARPLSPWVLAGLPFLGVLVGAGAVYALLLFF